MASSQPMVGRGRGRLPESSGSVPILAANNIISPSQPVSSIGRGRGRGLQQKQNQETTSNFERPIKSNANLPKPAGQGTIGTEIQVLVNYFPVLQYPKEGLVYQYYIEIRNRRNIEIGLHRRRGLYETWLHKFCRDHPNFNRFSFIFDNAKMILVFNQPLPNIDKTGVQEKIEGMNVSNQMEQFTFIIKLAGDPIDFSLLRRPEVFLQTHEDLTRIKQVLSIALHEHCSSHAEFIYHRTFYSQPTKENNFGYWDLGMGKALWRGFYSCLVFTNGEHKLLINLDVSHSVFMKKQPFINFLREVMPHSPCGKHQYRQRTNVRQANIEDVVYFLNQDENPDYYVGEMKFLLDQCRNLRVRWHHTKTLTTGIIHGLSQSAICRTFQWNKRGNRMITIQDYYREEYNIELQYPTLPLLEMKGKYVIYMPMELVDVEPVRVKKITDEQRALLCKYSSLKPQELHRAIQQITHDSKQQHFENNPYMHANNLDVHSKMLKTRARVIQKPTMTPNVQEKFDKAANFPPLWAMINFSSIKEDTCAYFYKELKDFALRRYIIIPEPRIYENFRVDPHTINAVIDKIKQIVKKNENCQFIIFILPESERKLTQPYGTLKKAFEVQFNYNVVTQMIQPRTIIACNNKTGKQHSYSILDLLLRKINSKLNGNNFKIEVHPEIERFFKRGHRTMYVGADLSHGASGSGVRRSIVAVVASADDIPNRYFKEIYIQERPNPPIKGEGRECIINMKEIMKSLIHQYCQHRGYPPSAIVFYRDGISIYEFNTVFIEELNGIRLACAESCSGYQPCITYIVVNKQHHTRFFSEDQNMKISSGTVVDSTDIIDATTYNFFLNSHTNRTGTSRPSHYHVLYDDNKLKPDQVQLLTYALCFTYARWAEPVSTPAPVKYADLLAYRASFYLDEYIDHQDNLHSSSGVISKRLVLNRKLAPDCPFFV